MKSTIGLLRCLTRGRAQHEAHLPQARSRPSGGAGRAALRASRALRSARWRRSAAPAAAAPRRSGDGDGAALDALGKRCWRRSAPAGADQRRRRDRQQPRPARRPLPDRTRDRAAAIAAPAARTAPPGLAKKSAIDPSKLPPASAGTNGTTRPPRLLAEPRRNLRPHPRATATRPRSCSPASPSPRPTRRKRCKNVINNANTIVGRPYVWGGGHASCYSYGYDCSGSVSFALFGGGLIPEPLTSGAARGLGRTRPRQVDHRLRQRRPHLRRDRRPALGHGRRRAAAPARAGTSRRRRPPASSPATRRASSRPAPVRLRPDGEHRERTGIGTSGRRPARKGLAPCLPVGERLDRDAVVGLPHPQLVGSAAAEGQPRGRAGRGARRSARGRRPSS